MTLTTPSAPTKEQRIAHLFLTGCSLDHIAEQGVLKGWTRDDARRVAETNGWQLDGSGRIPEDKRSGRGGPTITAPRPAPPVAGMDLRTAAVEALIARGSTHRLRTINTKAKRAQTAVDDLRKALVDQVAADRAAAQQEQETAAARARLAELEAERAELLKKIDPKAPRRPRQSKASTPIEHGTARGARQHIARGQDVCSLCKPPLDEAMQAMRAKREAQ